MNRRHPRIAISLGDPSGIGGEVTLKALATEPDGPSRYVLIGDRGWLERLEHRLGFTLNAKPLEDSSEDARIRVLDPEMTPLPESLEPGSALTAKASLRWLEAGARGCLEGHFDALVTAPVNKQAILRTDPSFVGQTEWLSDRAKTSRTAMMLLGQTEAGGWLRVALVTTHLPLREVAHRLQTRRVLEVIELAVEAGHQLGLSRPHVGVCGLNPHAGEGGALGGEEQELIEPAIRDAQGRGHYVTGPLAADTAFYQAYHGRYDILVAMYHDQGLAPLKMVAFDTGVNWTLGLPWIRTSPDHGTAYDLAGRDLANPASMQAAIRLAQTLVRTGVGELGNREAD